MDDYNLGYGIGLRRSHYDEIFKTSEYPDWFEIVSENFMNYGGLPRKTLEYLIDKNVPLISHGVGLSLGSIDEFDVHYLKELKSLLSFTNSKWFSDHLCFSSTGKHQFHDLLPILQTEKTLNDIVDKIKYIEDYFQIPFAFENISYYGTSEYNTIIETDFINEILHRTESHLLLDINNVYVNSKNHNFNPIEYLKNMNLSRVIQLHLAGHWDRGDIIIDTHGDYVPDDVWNLYREYLKLNPIQVSTLIEWDHDIPAYEIVLAESKKAKLIADEVLFGK